mmetsp:Transcript_74700/g.189626  ORF Transcript_74700/g.189626 Transcript_74700/m.189626 type:complete len:540 (-) Transcript_74700:80-1699(-)
MATIAAALEIARGLTVQRAAGAGGSSGSGDAAPEAKGLSLRWAELEPMGYSAGAAGSAGGLNSASFPPSGSDLAVYGSQGASPQTAQRSSDALMDDEARRWLAEAASAAQQSVFNEPTYAPHRGANTVEEAAQEAALAVARTRSSSFASDCLGAGEPKGRLSHLCQKLCRRPITKTDVVYAAYPVGRGLWQGSVVLNCIQGMEFGSKLPPSPDRKIAEKVAAMAALAAIMPHSEFATALASPTPASAFAALAAPAFAASTDDAHLSAFMLGMAKSSMAEPPAGLQAGALPKAGGMAPPVAAGLAAGFAAGPGIALEPSPGSDASEAAGQNPKQALNESLGRIVKVPLNKDSSLYATMTVPGGYQATLRLPCLPGAWCQQVWASKITIKKKDAETSAAAAALASILSEPTFFAVLSAPKQPPSTWQARAGGKGGIRAQQARLTSQAPKTSLRIAMEGEKPGDRPSWTVDISHSTTMSSVRAMIGTSRVFHGLPSEYLFSSDGMPIPRDQESSVPAAHFLPCATIMTEELRGIGRKRSRVS